MKILIASCEKTKLVEAKKYGIYGIITNPTIVSKINKPWKRTVKEAANLVDGPFHLQVTEEKKEDIINQVDEFAEVLGDRLIVKVCITKETLSAMPILQEKGHKVNMTGIVSLPQIFLAAQAGADYISVYVGRINDKGGNGMNIIKSSINYIKKNEYKAEIVAASVRTVKSYLDVARAGANWVACPYEILTKLIYHPITDVSIKNFKKDWDNIL